MESEGAADPCAICLGDVGRGQALFTAECSHVFHHRCISDSVAHGHRDCPLCKSTWRDLPAVCGPVVHRPPPPARTTPRPVPVRHAVPPARPPSHGPYDDDDEPAAAAAAAEQMQSADDDLNRRAADDEVVVLRTHCERSALARGASNGSFAVLVHARAPAAAALAGGERRAPLDLVTVIDVSTSMRGLKLSLAMQAVSFVVDALGPADRLSVVSFSNDAIRVLRLARMTADGKASAKRAVHSLVARGGTNIGEGLRVAAKVLADRRQRNAVTSVILLSDGRDGFVRHRHGDLVPSSFTAAATGGNRAAAAPIHTFGFGTDHDAAAMHAVAEKTGGTFSFVENEAAIQDSFAQCVAGLLSVAAQDLRIDVACVHPGVRVLGVKSGCYASRVDADRRAASVDVGELYADEERRFLLFLRVPAAERAEESTRLIKVRCSYKDALTRRLESVSGGDDVVVLRPVQVADGDTELLSMEVERERVRVAATEDMAAARAAAERGDHAEAARILEDGLEALRRSAPGMAGDDPTCAALEDELSDLRTRVANPRQYARTGRAAMLAGMSSHRQQRALSVALWRPYSSRGGRGGRRPYATPAMRKMVEVSRGAREQQRYASSPAPSAKRIRLGSPE